MYLAPQVKKAASYNHSMHTRMPKKEKEKERQADKANIKLMHLCLAIKLSLRVFILLQSKSVKLGIERQD